MRKLSWLTVNWFSDVIFLFFYYQVATWCTGEYADLLVQGTDSELEGQQVTESDIIDLFATALTSPVCSLATKEMVISTVMKLSVRLGPEHQE